jgi:hypothetical protein
MSRSLALCVLLVAAGCGRSSLLGGSSEDCPPALLDSDGVCHINGDGGHRDGGGDGPSSVCPGEQGCIGRCGDPSCCACAACEASLFCHPIDMGGDGPDVCADPKNCKLPVCAGDPRCHVLGTEICNNCIDDNDDGLIDCADPQCSSFPGCQPGHMCPSPPDCSDPTCACGPLCKNLKCMPTVDFGNIDPMNSSSTRMENTSGTVDVAVTPCAPGGAGMVVGQFNLTGDAAVKLSFMQNKGEDHVFGLFRAGTNQGCADNPVDCYDPKSATMGSHTFVNLTAGLYYVISQPFEPAGAGPVTVTLSTPKQMEICNNGIDDNGNGLIDCADPECFNAPNCVNQECKPDFNVGAIVVNTPGQTVSFSTTTADVENNITCGNKGGKDVVVRFTLKQTAGILLTWDQTGDHVVGLFRTPPPGQQCDADQISCYDPSGRSMDEVAWGEYPAGDYEFIFKALNPGDEGHIDATISAYLNRKVELCHNGIDDDGNGLIDCADPACIGVEGCGAPYCMPDVSFGAMQVGDQQTTQLDIANKGQLGYHASCSKGGGKGMVVEFDVANGGTNGGFGLGVMCNETGDQVIDLYPAGGPRDTCDSQTQYETCADPKTLPFGCNFEIPNMQPGKYFVLVESFQPGSAGQVSLTLSIIDDRQLEICNNGIDDDGNGLIDCKDPKCFTSQYCANSQCKPDASIDPMPLTGANQFELVQTSAVGVHGQVPCATATGGQTGVIEIGLTAAADLKLQWQQIGQHDFALFSDSGTQFPCDGGTLTGACTKSTGMGAAGMTSFTNVPQGKYYLLIQGDQPDGTTQYSGSVSIAISGTPH